MAKITRPAGYAALIEKYDLKVAANWHESAFVTGARHTIITDSLVWDSYPLFLEPTLGNHLEFALKHDGMNLSILSKLFARVSQEDLTSYIQSKPKGKYCRKIWFLYEYLTGNKLPIEDLGKYNYIDLLDSDDYYTSNNPIKVPRQKINDNLLGNQNFCPIVRRTEKLKNNETIDFDLRLKTVIGDSSTEVIKRAMSYLYTKETKSSFEIESLTPSATRTEKFIGLLQSAEKEDFCTKTKLIELQNRIVEERFIDTDYRKTQNYIGETVSMGSEHIHYISPQPKDITTLMAGLIESHRRLGKGDIHPVVHAAVISFGFVFLHPFEDGNGRIHRFLIHNILARQQFTPEDIIFPVSAAMLKNRKRYDDCLESYSRAIMLLVDYSLDEEGHMTVDNDIIEHYRFMDMTNQVEALFYFIEQTIEKELAEELTFLRNYDQTKQAIQEIVDMPDRKIDLFISFCLQNDGTLSTRKRKSTFEFLTTKEIDDMQQAVRDGYKLQ